MPVLDCDLLKAARRLHPAATLLRLLRRQAGGTAEG
eukprot:SAG11_NODE_9613_length_896_cov_1.056462_1_plen_36_part_00